MTILTKIKNKYLTVSINKYIMQSTMTQQLKHCQYSLSIAKTFSLGMGVTSPANRGNWNVEIGLRGLVE